MLFPDAWSASEEMTKPSVVKDLLMLEPSFKWAPLAPVLPARSLPARSTREILLTFWPVCSETGSYCSCVMMRLNTAWDLLLSEFMLVDATVLLRLPSSISVSTVAKSFTANLVRP